MSFPNGAPLPEGISARFNCFDRAQWSSLRADTPLTLSEDELMALRGVDVQVSLEEVRQIYLPLSRLVNLHIQASKALYQNTFEFLGHQREPVPYIIGLAGSVAVGKSTAARILRALLARWPHHPNVALISTDGFLMPNAKLEARGIMHRKGFPESYETNKLLKFLSDIKSGKQEVEAPIYSHLEYDIIKGKVEKIQSPDVLILEGLNVLQTNTLPNKDALTFVSDFFDFSIYLDADEKSVRHWFMERFHTLKTTRFSDPKSYFHQYASFNDEEAERFAQNIWRTINGVNLTENIAPTRNRANVILHKSPDHSMDWVAMRRL